MMSDNNDSATIVQSVCQTYGNDRSRLLDIVQAVQSRLQCVDVAAMNRIARAIGCHRVEVESIVSFYGFLSSRPQGHVVIRLCNDIIDEMKGSDKVSQAFCDALEIDFGQTTSDGMITLLRTPCIGMCDQAPAALINDVVVTHLGSEKARTIVHQLRADPNPARLVQQLGDGHNAHDLVHSMVRNNIRLAGEVVFSEMGPGAGIQNALAMNPVEVCPVGALLPKRVGFEVPVGQRVYDSMPIGTDVEQQAAFERTSFEKPC